MIVELAPLSQKQRSAGMAKIMKSDLGELRAGDKPLESSSHRSPIERRAYARAEDQAVLLPRRPRRKPLLYLTDSVSLESGDCKIGRINRTTAPIGLQLDVL